MSLHLQRFWPCPVWFWILLLCSLWFSTRACCDCIGLISLALCTSFQIANFSLLKTMVFDVRLPQTFWRPRVLHTSKKCCMANLYLAPWWAHWVCTLWTRPRQRLSCGSSAPIRAWVKGLFARFLLQDQTRTASFGPTSLWGRRLASKIYNSLA